MLTANEFRSSIQMISNAMIDADEPTQDQIAEAVICACGGPVPSDAQASLEAVLWVLYLRGEMAGLTHRTMDEINQEVRDFSGIVRGYVESVTEKRSLDRGSRISRPPMCG